MKTFCLLAACFCFVATLHTATPLQPDAGGVTLEVPDEGRIEVGTTLSISFPSAMVAADKIDLGGQPSPVVFSPLLPGDWLWKSLTDGQFQIKKPVLPGQTYTARLATNLRDADGKPVAPPGWGAELHTERFTVSTDFEEDDHLSALPGVVLKFTAPVRLTDAAKHVYFRDRDSGARQDAEISLREEDRDEEPEAAVLRATPLAPLPVGRTWDLIVEDVRAQDADAPLPYLKRVPLGVTAPLQVKWVGAFNLPLETPLIRVRFDANLDPATVKRDAVAVEPPLPNLSARADDDDLIVEGDFDLAKHYTVTVAPSVKGRRGYGLAAPARWGATFHPKPSALFFPDSHISERSALGLRFSFLAFHTSTLRWRLAAVPLEKLAAVNRRLREFENSKKNPFSGNPVIDDAGLELPQPTELLIDAFALETRAQGTFPASDGEAATLRDIRWSPPGGKGVPCGAYLLEVDGPRWDGKGTVGHRSLVCFSESVITQKRTPDTVFARVAGMSDGLPRAGVTVRALSDSNFEVARAVTDRDGLARFAWADLIPPKNQRGGEPARTFVADTPEGPSVVALDGDGLDPDAILPDKPADPPRGERRRAVVLTDRSLYRPGQTVRIKGLVRTARADGGDHGALHIPSGRTAHWTVTNSDLTEPTAQGDATIDPEGGWDAQWTIAANAKPGDYRLACTLDGADAADASGDGVANLRVQDYKVPLFEVTATADPVVPPTNNDAVCRVRAGYFSGQPVAGARVSWRIHWERDDSGDRTRENDDAPDENDAYVYTQDDQHSERAVTAPPDHAPPPESKGDARLDAHGETDLHAPLPPNMPGARYRARWEIATTSADGQSVAAGSPPTQTVMRQPVLLGVRALTEETERADASKIPSGTVRVRLAAYDADDKITPARDARVELFRVRTKTVRETVAPFVIRYRNTPHYESVKTADVAQIKPGTFVDIATEESGHYVAVVSAPGLRPVSSETFAAGPGEDEVPVETPTSLGVKGLDKKEYVPGEKAAFVTRSPVSGVAWVSIESDRILDTVLVPLPGSTTRIDFPVKPDYAPDATVAVYLLRPGGGDRLPAERFGTAKLRVRRPDRELQVRPTLATPRVRPGEPVRGSVRVVSENKPVAGADVTVWAVDDAILALGEWKAPDLATAFYPGVPHRVQTYAALNGYLLDISRKSLFQKGFVIGGGGEEFGSKFVRKDFQPLAYWKTGLRTDADGRVPVEFGAPDNLTRYRVVAVAQTRAGQFGEGEGSVEVAKPLIVEPSLPRFLRAGDEVELRAVVRQSVRDRVDVAAVCTADAGLTLDGTSEKVVPVSAARDQPTVFRFRAKVPDGPTTAKITFHAGTAPADPDTADATEITLPILPPTILRREGVAGTIQPGGNVSSLLPEDARRPGATGRYDVAVSTRADFPGLQALPAVLEYPHGCFEQITSRVLAYGGVHELLDAVPTDPEQGNRYRRIVEDALARCAKSLMPDGLLPYWASQTAGNAFVTVQAAWAAHLAAHAGFNVDLHINLKRIVDDAADAPAVRAFAMMVQATVKSDDDTLDADAARALFLHRENLGDEGRALLAVALHRAGIMPDETLRLLREIMPLANGAKPLPERAFDAETFGSTRRAEMLTAWACAEVRPPGWKPADAVNARARVRKLLDRAALNSTQENLWALFAYQALGKNDDAPKLRASASRVSPDKTAAAWTGLPLGKDAALFIVPNDLATAPLTGVLTAEYRVGRAEEDARRDRGGMRVERVVQNLTDAHRTGRPGEPPIHLNDRLLVSYRMQTPKLRAYVALEDELAAGLETVNPDLPLFAPFYELPTPAPGEQTADASSVELHDNVTRAYFDRLAPGVSVYRVLARASAAGSFRWPATQAGPMYEPAVGGLAPSEQIVVAGE